MAFECGTHEAFIYDMGGEVALWRLQPIESVRWERVRDEISTASVTIPTTECCDELGQIRCILHELHIWRNGISVWQGPVTRIEYEHDVVRIYAEDMLFVPKRRVLQQGYVQAYPNMWDVVARMDWLLRDNCYAMFGDTWNMVPRLHPFLSDGNPKTSRSVNNFQFYVWEDFDKYAEDSGADYTVVDREIYYFDTHLAWNVLPPLNESHISQFPRLVEYGNEAATRCFVTNGEGFTGYWIQPDDLGYGVIDFLITIQQDGSEEGPTPEEIDEWNNMAAHNLDGKIPPPVSIVVPENSTLLPGAPWDIESLIPGSWFQMTLANTCRPGTAWQKLHHVLVTETAQEGELVQITSASPPSTMIVP